MLRDHLRADPCRSTRVRLAELLCTVGDDADRDEVLAQMRLAEDDQERAGIAYALGARFTPRVFVTLRALLRDERADPRLRAGAAHALGRKLDHRTPHRFAELLRGSNWRLQPDWLDTLVTSTL
ncbi:MAG TPA: HEAT repeat domain-containing protein [Planctomycetota bacterium]|nr:HEAT repeat domain-containing protein [Planctomycetota bacterium]